VILHGTSWWEGAGVAEAPWWAPRAADLVLAAVALFLGGVLLLLRGKVRQEERRSQLYREVLDSAADGLLAVSDGNRIVHVSARASRLFGYEPREMLGRSLDRLLSPPKSALAGQLSGARKASSSPNDKGPHRELVGTCKDGTEIIVECLTGPPLPLPGGPATTVFLRDITKSKKTHDLLHAREAHLRLVVEQMPAILWTTDTDLRITSTLGAGLAAVNLRPEEVIGMSMRDCLEREDVDSTPIAAHRKAVGGESLDYEMEWKGRTFQVRVEPLRRPSKRIVGTVGILLDITENKRAEEARRRLVAILEATPDFVAIAGRDNRLTYVNRAGREMLGLADGEDVTGRTLDDLYPDDARQNGLAVSVRVASERGVWSGETIFRGRDGRPIPVSQVMIAHRPPGGPVEFLSTVARDVSERRRLEEQCRQAQKMEAVGTLAGGVAHDFNNMLCVITGFSDFLAQGLPEDSPLREYAREIGKAAERAAGLTRQLLAFSRKQMLVPRILNLNALVADTEKMLRRLIGEDVEFTSHLNPSLAPVRADPGQIEQVLMNLVVNARDAMPQGGKLTTRTANVVLGAEDLRGRPEVRPGAYVLLEVADTGCGMSKEVLDHMFEPFFTTKEVGKGTGLGLATVYGIVKQSGGHVEVDSAPGRGSTFRIYLPRIDETDQSEQDSPPEVARGGAETVLLVEDEDAVRSLAGESLRQRGYHVLEAGDGEEALTLCSRYPGRIDLLLTDAVMPRVSGGNLAQRVRSTRPETRVLFMSGFTDSVMVRNGVALGEVDCLSKPFGPEALTQAVRRALDTASPSRCGIPRREPEQTHDRTERRLTQRHCPSPDVRVECHKGSFGQGPNLAEALVDVSVDGMRIIAGSALWAGEVVEVLLTPPGDSPIKRRGRVVWSRPSPDARHLTGLQFRRRLTPAELRRLV
jgi:PAS domain S-box-containing protein